MSDDHSCDAISLDGPDAAAAAGRLGVLGFVALWRGERPAVASLCDDPAVVEAQSMRDGSRSTRPASWWACTAS